MTVLRKMWFILPILQVTLVDLGTNISIQMEYVLWVVAVL